MLKLFNREGKSCWDLIFFKKIFISSDDVNIFLMSLQLRDSKQKKDLSCLKSVIELFIDVDI